MNLRDLFEVKKPALHPSELGDLLAADAGKYLNTAGVKTSFLYRGLTVPLQSYTTEEIDGSEVSWIIMDARRDREPVSTPKAFSNAADAYFNQHFRWTPRRDGTFAVKNLSLARDYGEGNIFIPLGDFRFIWSEDIADLYIAYDEIKEDWYEANLSRDEMIEKWVEYLDTAGYTNQDLGRAIASDHEIMFDCNQYLLVHLPLSRGPNGGTAVAKVMTALTGIKYGYK
jgi:hypothetical protein